jgi:phosphoglycolate phosphatase-like HAD superfamily hydrolase
MSHNFPSTTSEIMAPRDIEIINPDFPRGPFRAAIFDFDGTLSLLRRNWQDVMIPMMVEELAATGTAESREELRATVEDFVMRLNGRQTIYQMIQLAEEVASRGGQPREPLEYKRQYHDLLWSQVGERVSAVKRGAASAEEMSVPGARQMLAHLNAHGVALYLASGTDLNYVQDELQTLGLAEFFGPRVYGALDDYKKFSKAMIIARIVEETGVAGRELVGFGDGFVEIEEVKKVGGLAVGVASNETTRKGVNAWKRNRLVHAGADVIIGDYRELDELIGTLGI